MVRILILCLLCCGFLNRTHGAQSLSECQKLFAVGQYESCLQAVTEAIENRSYGEEWPILKAQCEFALGQYPETLNTIAAGIERYSWSVRLRQLEYEAALANDRAEQATAALKEIERLVSTASWRYTDADDLAALGQAALALGVDARAVQEGFFERARKNYPNRPDGYVAAARLALDKNDPAFAAELLMTAVRDFPENAEVLFLMSEALKSADRDRSAELLQAVLQINPNYAPALLQLIERRIDSEDYDGADSMILRVLSINPHHPDALALQSVIHHLKYREEEAAASRSAALKFAPANPRVDFIMGRKLSQKYRFAEGAEFQRKALASDPDFTPAKIQLAQDLLRLGLEEEGWRLAEEAHAKDGYDTTLFNLLRLKDSLNRYTDVTSEHFRVRMEKREAAVYGPAVVKLLESAWAELTERYDFHPDVPVIVEIYARADDFAVRTFGLPDVAGFLGVCFGKVVTANSPASRTGQPTSWESVLWHEFCHVITLQKTGNRIPRWLSEGISVFEERRRDPRWGQRMNGRYRDRILADRITPVSLLSSAFLNAESGEDMNFAYYQSSMVVEFIAVHHGLPALNAILQDLHTGLQINDALERHTGGIEVLESSFREWIVKEAGKYAPDIDFSSEAFAAAGVTDRTGVESFLEDHPGSLAALLFHAELLMSESMTREAEELLLTIVEKIPDDGSLTGPRTRLAELYRKQGRAEDEALMLSEHVRWTADDLAAAIRLQELAEASQRHHDVVEYGRLALAIDPFQTSVIQRSLRACESQNLSDTAIPLLSSLLELQPDDRPRTHYRIAKLLIGSDREAARRHVLLSLERAPRFRDAHRLLLELQADHNSNAISP